MSSYNTLTILSDQPTSKDLLDFTPYAETLREVVLDSNTDTPLAIGIFGSWGSGKTSLMQMISDGLDRLRFKTVWFDAWKYDKDYSLWRAFLLRVLDSLRPASKETKQQKELAERIEHLEEGLYRDISWEEKGKLSVNWPELIKGVTGGAVQLSFALVPGLSGLGKAVEAAESALGEGKVSDNASSILKAFQRDAVEHYQAQLRFVEQFQREFADLVDKYIVQGGQRLIVFVDDLDRCLPERTLEVLDAIKLFMDVPGCVFVLGLDQAIVTKGIQMRYGDDSKNESVIITNPLIEGEKYIEKIVQLPFILPPIEAEMMESFILSLSPSLPDKRCAAVFASGLAQIPNPRQVKRAVNVFLLLWKLSEKRRQMGGPAISAIRLAKIVAIQNGHPDLYEQFRYSPVCVRDLEIYFRRINQPEQDATSSPPAVSPSLQVFTGRSDLQRLLMLYAEDSQASFGELTIDQLKIYATLVSRTATEPKPPGTKRPSAAQIGHYEILSEIGRGGFATVYKARDTKLDRLVALKVFSRVFMYDLSSAERFINSARVWASLDHPNIIKIYEFGEYEGNLSISMQLIDGHSLDHILQRQGRLPWKAAISIAGQIASALDYTHNKGTLHLDVKPGNILMDSKQQAFLTDFGLIQMVIEQTALSRSAFMVGTVQYMAPEQFEQNPVSSASDEYALATVFYEMITGIPLFPGEVIPVIRAKLDAPLSLPASWPNDVPQDIEPILRKALHRDPKQRYQLAGDFIKALETLTP